MREFLFLNSWEYDDGSFLCVWIILSLDLQWLLGCHWLQYKSLLLPCIVCNLDSRKIHYFCCHQVVPVPVLARTSTGRVGLRNAAVRSSPARVEASNHIFGECSQAARLLAGVGDDRLLPGVSLLIALLPFYTASSGTATSTGTMSTSASGSAAG